MHQSLYDFKQEIEDNLRSTLKGNQNPDHLDFKRNSKSIDHLKPKKLIKHRPFEEFPIEDFLLQKSS
jgi:acyl dehydratase